MPIINDIEAIRKLKNEIGCIDFACKDCYKENLCSLGIIIKQLQRLQKENEQLKKRLEIADKQMADEEANYYEMQEHIETLEADIEYKYKPEIEQLKIKLKMLKELSSPKILTNETLNMMMFDKAQKYETALEEIREIINKELPTKVLQKNGQVPMIYYSDYMNEVKYPILKVLESEGE